MNANDAILRSAAPLADPRVDLSRTVRAPHCSGAWVRRRLSHCSRTASGRSAKAASSSRTP